MKHWNQERFYISTFEAIRGAQGDYRKLLSANKEAGIDFIELVFKDRETVTGILEVCEELGIQTIVQDRCFGGIGDQMSTPDDAAVKEAVAYYSKYKQIYGYFVWDEPVMDAFKTVRNTKDLFEQNDPGKLLFCCGFPSYGVYNWGDHSLYNWKENSYTNYIDTYIDTIDPYVVCFDYYPFRTAGMSIVNSDLWRDIGYVSKRAREVGKPFWFYFQGVDTTTGTNGLSRNEISTQMFAAIAYNAKALSWFVTADVLTDLEGNKKENYEELKSANFEAKALGQFFFDKELSKLYHTPKNVENEQIYFLDSMETSDILVSAPDYCIVSEFTDATDKKYLMIVNRQHDLPVEGKIVLRKPMQVEEFDKAQNTVLAGYQTEEIMISLAAGDAAAFILSE